MITKETEILYREKARNADACGQAKVPAGRIFNFDAFCEELGADEAEFLNSCSTEYWTRVPEELLDPTTAQNFICSVKLL